MRVARALENDFSSFTARDIQDLGVGDAICRVGRSAEDFNLRVRKLDDAPHDEAALRRTEIVDASHARYAVSRQSVETSLRSQPTTTKPDPKESPPSHAPKPPVVRAPTSTAAQPPPASHSTTTAARVSEPGRGGAQHKAIQLRLKKGAEALGFRVSVEKPILDGSGSVDLVLERDSIALPCEITVTTTIDHEVGNIAKCLKAGFPEVAAVGVDQDKLARLLAATATSLGTEVASRVHIYLPDDFLTHLESLPRSTPSVSQEKSVRGYKVKTTFRDLPPEDVKARENAIIGMIADSMRRKRS